MFDIVSIARWLRKTCKSTLRQKEETNCVKFYNTFVEYLLLFTVTQANTKL